MIELFTKHELIIALKAGLFGMVVGGLFSLLKFKPPSPDNLSGIFGILGIFFGWVFISSFIK